MSSKSIQYRSNRTQPHYQVSSSKNLPHTKPKERRDGPTNVSLEKKKRVKIQFYQEYQYIQKMMKNPKTGYNWRLLKPKKLGYIILENWSNFNQIKGNQIKGNQLKGNQIKGNQIKGNQIKGNQIKGNQIKGNQRGVCSEKPIIWGFIHPNNGFIYLGNKTETWKLGLSHSYFNPKYFTGKEDPLALLDQLVMPLDL